MSELLKITGVQKSVALAKYSTFGMGGPADFFVDLVDFSLLPALIDVCKNECLPYFILGWGSNVVFSEKGFRGLVIRLNAKEIVLDGVLICASAGALLSQVITFALDKGYVGMEKMMGIPGTVGGAVRGNAGAYGVEIKDFFVKATVFNEASGVSEWDFDRMKFSYRSSDVKIHGGIIERVWLKLPAGDAVASRNEIREIVSSRVGKHPQGYSCGSFFKNPSRNSQGIGLSAGMAIEQAGMKSARVGGAFVSEKHANFLMSDGSATLADLRALVRDIQKAVEAKFGILLEPEVQVMDENGKIDF